MTEAKGILYVVRGSASLLQLRTDVGKIGQIVGHVPVSGTPRDACTDFPYLYVTTSFDGLKIFLLSEGTGLPGMIGNLRLAYSGEHIALNDSLVFIAGVGGVSVIDVSDRKKPRLLSQVGLTHDPAGMIYYNNRLYLALGNRTVEVINLDDPKHPGFSSAGPAFKTVTGITLSAPYLFVSEDNQITVLNALDIELPVVLRIKDTTGIYAITVQDNYLYVSTKQGLTVYQLYRQ
jgi:hypothetical protein